MEEAITKKKKMAARVGTESVAPSSVRGPVRRFRPTSDGSVLPEVNNELGAEAE